MGKSKYAGIIDQLPREFGTDPDFQDKVNAIKTRVLADPDLEETVLPSDAILDYAEDIRAMLTVLNDALIRSVGDKKWASTYAQAYRDLRKVKALYDEQEKTLNVIMTAYEQLLIEQYEVEGTTNLKLEDGSSVRTQPEPHGKVVDKDAVRKWAIQHGLENLLSLPWQTVNALTKEALLQGEAPPDGVEATARTKVVYTKG